MTDDAPATRDRILDAAERAFADGGFAGARVDAIAAEAGVNKAMLYYYFASKEGLYRAVLERVFDAIQAVALERLATVDEENVGAFLAGYRAVLRSHPAFVRLAVRELAGGGERLLPLVAPRLQPVVGQAVVALERARVEGRLNPEVRGPLAIPVLVAPFLMFALAHPLLGAVSGLPADELRDLFDRTAEEILLHGLLRRAEEDTP